MFENYFDSEDWKGRKEKRAAYRRAKAHDRTCRNHGSCEYCRANREFFDKKARDAADKQIKDIDKE